MEPSLGQEVGRQSPRSPPNWAYGSLLVAACLRVCVSARPRTCSLQPSMGMDSKSAASGRRRAPDPGAETSGWRPRRDLQGGIRSRLGSTSASPMRPETCTHPASSSLGPFLAHALGLPPQRSGHRARKACRVVRAFKAGWALYASIQRHARRRDPDLDGEGSKQLANAEKRDETDGDEISRPSFKSRLPAVAQLKKRRPDIERPGVRTRK